MSVNGIKREYLLGIPIDYVEESQLKEVIWSLSDNKERNLVVFLTFRDFMRARRNKKYREMIEKAALVIPVSGVITEGFRFCGMEQPPRFLPFSFMIRTFKILEDRGQSVSFLGGTLQSIKAAKANMNASFPTLKIVGLYKGSFSCIEEENDVLIAIKKAAPTFFLVGARIRRRWEWLLSHLDEFSPGIFVYDEEMIDIMSRKKESPGEKRWQKSKDFGCLFMYWHYRILLRKFRKKKRVEAAVAAEIQVQTAVDSED